MTKVRLLRQGDSLGLVLPPELVERLGLHEGDEISVDDATGALTLSHGMSMAERRRDAVEHVLTTHARTLELLAKR